ncbi:hypothetical protein SGLAM104S_05332 [Streptomyces glaucescens]
MPHSAPSAAPTRVPPPDRADPHDRTAPYVLVRTTVLPYPAETAPSAVVRTLLAGLTTLTARDAALRAALSDDLFAARGGHDEDFHRRVVLPLRRALHNGREPRPALLGRLGALPDRVPRLADWLALREQRARLLAELDAAVPPALAAERSALAGLCRSPAFTRAIALTSADLLRAIDQPDGVRRGAGRARKRPRSCGTPCAPARRPARCRGSPRWGGRPQRPSTGAPHPPVRRSPARGPPPRGPPSRSPPSSRRTARSSPRSPRPCSTRHAAATPSRTA